MPVITDPLEHIRALAEAIGPRPSTGEGERRAAAYIEGCLASFGFAVKLEPFSAPSSFSYAYVLAYAIGLLGVVFAGVGLPAIAVALSAVGLLAFAGENTTLLPLASRVQRRRPSSNVVARLIPGGVPRKRLVIVAHYDTGRSGLMFHPRLVKRFRRSFQLSGAALVLLPILQALQLVTTRRLFWYLSLVVVVQILYSVLLLLHRELRGKPVPGANDNASGVGVALSLAQALSVDAPRETEIMVVATGCEESGLWGMRNFISKHREDLKRAWIINIDSVGAGQVHYTTEEGMLMRRRVRPDLLELAKSIGERPHLSVSGIAYRTMSSGGEVAMRRGIDTITVIATDKRAVPVNWHWKTDTVDNIDPDSVDTAYRFAEQMVRRLIAR